jgi:hypothetical protein
LGSDPVLNRGLLGWIRRAGRAWIALELSAGIIALCLLISLLPAVECLMVFPVGWSWKVAIGASVNGVVGALYLGKRALMIPAELLSS